MSGLFSSSSKRLAGAAVRDRHAGAVLPDQVLAVVAGEMVRIGRDQRIERRIGARGRSAKREQASCSSRRDPQLHGSCRVRLTHAHLVADRDLAARHHLAIDAAIGVAEASASASAGIARSRMPVSGSTLVAAQRTMRLTIFSRASSPIAISCPSRSNSCQAGQPRDVDVAAKAQRMDRRADRVFERGDRGEIDDRDDLARDIREAVARRVQHLRRPAQLVGAEGREELLDRGAALGRAQVAARGLAAVVLDRPGCGSRRRSGCAAWPAARSASASGSAASADSRAPPGRSRTARSRWRRAGRPAAVCAGREPRARAAAPGTGPSPDSGRSPGSVAASAAMAAC